MSFRKICGIVFVVSVTIIAGLVTLGIYYPNLQADLSSNEGKPGNIQGWIICLASLSGILSMFCAADNTPSVGASLEDDSE
jgi:hypothetical protein